jgi:hypothetical protein
MTCPDSAANLIRSGQRQAPFPEANVDGFALTQDLVEELTESGASVMAATLTRSTA